VGAGAEASVEVTVEAVEVTVEAVEVTVEAVEVTVEAVEVAVEVCRSIARTTSSGHQTGCWR
jgi:phage baseplate assembly protein gpV